MTNMTREESIFELQPQFRQVIAENIQREGSNLGHVTAACLWEDGDERLVCCVCLLKYIHLPFYINIHCMCHTIQKAYMTVSKRKLVLIYNGTILNNAQFAHMKKLK